MERTEGPWIPGREARFLWPDRDDPDQDLLIREVEGGGKFLSILYLPFTVGGTQIKVLAEMYTPEDLRDATWHMTDPRQKADWQDGLPIVLWTVGVQGSFQIGDGLGSVHAILNLTPAMVQELNRNNRNSRMDLARHHDQTSLEKALREGNDADLARALDASGFGDAFVEAYEDTLKFAMNKPRVTGADLKEE